MTTFQLSSFPPRLTMSILILAPGLILTDSNVDLKSHC